MKLNHWFGAAVALFFLFSLLAIPQPGQQRFDFPPDWNGDALTPQEHATTQTAINNIATPPPASIEYWDAAGNHKIVPVATIAARLQGQLDNGKIEAEIQNEDVDGGEYQQSINISDDLLDDAANSAGGMTHLEEILIHEWTHKDQDGSQGVDGDEVEARDAEIAYKDSIGLPPGDLNRNWAYRCQVIHWHNYYWGRWLKDIIGRMYCRGWVTEVEQGDGAGHDRCRIYHHGDSTGIEYDLDPMRCSDLIVFNGYFADGDALLMLCGFVPDMGGRLTSLVISESGFAGVHELQDFPMFLYTIARAPTGNLYYAVDTAAAVIHRLLDVDGDQLPEAAAGIYASAANFPPLDSMRSVEVGQHPFFGEGLIVNPGPARYSTLIQPYEWRWFLMDTDGDEMADQCLPVRRCEFMRVSPRVQITPWAGEVTARVLGTWEHEIALFATDESGEIEYEMLGMVHLADSIQVSLPLARPLLAGEFVRPRDLVTGSHAPNPTAVIDPTPQEFVIFYLPLEDVMRFCWEPVPGAGCYQIWWTDDLNDAASWTEFSPPLFADDFESGTTDCWSTVLPLPRTEEQAFFRVTASR